MNRKFLEYYRQELSYIRERAGEFAEDYPKIAGRLELDPSGSETCPDPFVERLLEGFAFLAARIQLKYDAEYPRLLQSLFDTIVPNYLAPTPSMAVVRIEPDYDDADLATGYVVPRNTELRGRLGRGDRTPCIYTTAHAVTLLPLKVTEAQYYSRDLGVLHLPSDVQAKAVIRIRLEATAGLRMEEIEFDYLDFFVRGSDAFPEMVLETLFADIKGIGYREADERSGIKGRIDPGNIMPLGIGKDESILPVNRRVFSGYRLLREYFCLRQRFHFFRISGMSAAFQAVDDGKMDLMLFLDQARPDLDSRIDAESFSLHATPIVNLFERRSDPIQLSRGMSEYPVIVDKTRSFDFEVFSVKEVIGKGNLAEERMQFHPFYFSPEKGIAKEAYYAVRRAPRQPTAKERRFGKLSEYTGSDIFISLVDGSCMPVHPDLQQLSMRVLCTNRHLPMSMFTGGEPSDFSCELGGPINGFSCIIDPTNPKPSITEGDFGWRLVSHLSLNHYSLVDDEEGKGAYALRELMKLYSDISRKDVLRELDGLVSVKSIPITRRLPSAGQIAFGRGLEVKLTFNEDNMEGLGLYSIGLALAQFLSRYVNINSFTETVIHSEQRGEVIKWKRLTGLSPLA